MDGLAEYHALPKEQTWNCQVCGLHLCVPTAAKKFGARVQMHLRSRHPTVVAEKTTKLNRGRTKKGRAAHAKASERRGSASGLGSRELMDIVATAPKGTFGQDAGWSGLLCQQELPPRTSTTRHQMEISKGQHLIDCEKNRKQKRDVRSMLIKRMTSFLGKRRRELGEEKYKKLMATVEAPLKAR